MSTLPSFKGPYARRRCLVPATHYHEWTTDPANPKGRKLMWRFTMPGQTAFGARQLPEGPPESFTFLRSAPGPDQALYHNREPVVLRRASGRSGGI